MKEWIFGGGVILIGATAVWLISARWQRGSQPVVENSQPAAEARATDAPKTDSNRSLRESKRERKAAKRDTPVDAFPILAESVPIPPPSVRELVAPKPLPAPIFAHVGELTRGLDRSEIQSRFGEPDWRASKSERGSLLETFVYRRKVDGRIVAISMKNGAVEKVQSEIP